ncbi:hypothetical protein SDJN02_20707, partial [Cucurbita argyrosperma subsp. argyrosperma]
MIAIARKAEKDDCLNMLQSPYELLDHNSCGDMQIAVKKARAEAIEFLRTMPWRQEILHRRGDWHPGFGVRRNCACDEFPGLYAWTHNLKKAALIRDNLPDADKLAGIYKRLYEQRQGRTL